MEADATESKKLHTIANNRHLLINEKFNHIKVYTDAVEKIILINHT